MNILLLVHVIVAILLIVVILMQKTGADGISNIGGGNSGLVSGRTAASFLTNITIGLATIFMINAIILANLSAKRSPNIEKELLKNSSPNSPIESNTVPIAK